MSKRPIGDKNDYCIWFYNHVLKYYDLFDTVYDVLDVTRKLATFVLSMRNVVTDPDLDHTTCQLQLFDYLKNEINAKSRPTEFVYIKLLIIFMIFSKMNVSHMQMLSCVFK